MKGLKIFNIVLFSIICAIEAIALYYLSTSIISFFTGDILGMVMSLIAFLPLFIVFMVILLILSIIITSTSKSRIRKAIEQNLPKSKFDKLCIALPWIFIAVNLVLFFGFMLIGKISANKA